ncbi:MAG: hypothetical protein B7Y88_13850 [Sphingomonadales bacterium 32-64-17]|nr:MAG: hypothetical protein B7Y88_13850 [Sphingomonadales bacterium 32-64-17]
MAVSQANRIRYRATLISREVKALFKAVPSRFFERLAGRFLFGRLLRWLFLGREGEVHRAGEIVLAELRNRYMLKPVFSTDPLVMARRAGQREVLEDIFNYLNLDETTVRKLMELDDGLE